MKMVLRLVLRLAVNKGPHARSVAQPIAADSKVIICILLRISHFQKGKYLTTKH